MEQINILNDILNTLDINSNLDHHQTNQYLAIIHKIEQTIQQKKKDLQTIKSHYIPPWQNRNNFYLDLLCHSATSTYSDPTKIFFDCVPNHSTATTMYHNLLQEIQHQQNKNSLYYEYWYDTHLYVLQNPVIYTFTQIQELASTCLDWLNLPENKDDSDSDDSNHNQ